MAIRTRRFWRPRNHRVVGMSFDMLLEVLRTLEALATKVAFVRLQWDMNADVRGDVVAFDGRRMTISPRTHQVEVVRTLAADMTIADVFLAGQKSVPSSFTTGPFFLVLGRQVFLSHSHKAARHSQRALHIQPTGTAGYRSDHSSSVSAEQRRPVAVAGLQYSTHRAGQSPLPSFLESDEREPPPRPCRIGDLRLRNITKMISGCKQSTRI